MFYRAQQKYPIQNTHIYKFDNGNFYVSFDTRNQHEKFYGPREQIIPQMAARIKHIMRVR